MRVDGVGRECVQSTSNHNREPGFFVIAVEKFFSFRPDWHQHDCAQPLVRQYQFALDSVLEAHPELEPCVARCVHCGIRFLTHPRNAGRADLRCPFGCSRQHRRQRSTQRSSEYYRTTAGKKKKKRLNALRCCPSRPEQPTALAAHAPKAAAPNELPRDGLSPMAELRLGGVVLHEATLLTSRMMPYVRMVVSLIEGVELSGAEVSSLLRRAMRQHSIASRTRSEYVLHFLHKHPP